MRCSYIKLEEIAAPIPRGGLAAVAYSAMLRWFFKSPYRPVAQAVYWAGAGILGGVLLIVGQPWGIGLAAMGGLGVVLSGLGAVWRQRYPD
jgi:hypothetical protein